MTLNARILAVVGALALLILGIVGVTWWVTAAQKADGLVINLAGRQRMLTQKFTKEFLDWTNDRQVLASAEQVAATASRQICADRSYYSKNVAKKLRKERPDVKTGDNYHNVEGMIPISVTFVREVSESFDQAGEYRYDLLSKWNINPDKGLRDEYEQRAWDSLKQNPDSAYVEVVPAGAGVEVRYATADIANRKGCVSCHNQHPASPKLDFKLDELMGILVVSVPVTQNPVLAQIMLSGDSDNRRHQAAETTRKLFEVTLAALQCGGTTYKDLGMTQSVSIPANTDPQIDEQLAKAEQVWNDLQGTVAETRAMKPDFRSDEYVARLQSIRDLNITCLENMNAAVGMFQANSDARTALMRNTQYGAVGLALFVFGFAVYYLRSHITGPINRIIAGLNEGADQVNDASAEVSSASQELAEGASEQASSLEETSSALEQMAAMTRTNAENAKEANNLSSQARDAAQSGDETMEKLNGAMTAINESSGQISKIIKVIEEIAFQTNLLALNAAVEAARAGEHGKGFAVVADEVRNLAQRAAQAARETTGLIDDSVTKAKEGTDVAGEVGKALSAIVGDVTKVTDLIDGITKASEEQAQGVEQVNTAVSQMDKVTQRNAAGAEESASAAEELSAQAQTVKGIVEELSTLVSGGHGGNAHTKS